MYKKLYVLFSKPVEDRRRVRAILPYTKVPETDEIRLFDFIKCILSNTVYTLAFKSLELIENNI